MPWVVLLLSCEAQASLTNNAVKRDGGAVTACLLLQSLCTGPDYLVRRARVQGKKLWFQPKVTGFSRSRAIFAAQVEELLSNTG